MPRKLKTYQTSLGFFDLAIAAPSMKAALEAWGSNINLFHQGFAKETGDPAIVQATMANPGVVLKRPVGSNGPFTEHAALPKHLPVGDNRPARAKTPAEKKPAMKRTAPPRKHDEKAARAAVVAFEKAQKSGDSSRRKEEAARGKEQKRRAQAIDRAERALEAAKLVHEKRTEDIQKARAALDGRSTAEDARWASEKKKLETALGRARG
jgi:hypothetical protein